MGQFWELRLSAILKHCNHLKMMDGFDPNYRPMPLDVRCCRCSHVIKVDVTPHARFPGFYDLEDRMYADDDLTDQEKETFQRFAQEQREFTYGENCWMCSGLMWIVWYASGEPLETVDGDGDGKWTSDGRLVMFYMHGVEPSENDYELYERQWQVQRMVDGKLFDDVVLVNGCASYTAGDYSSTDDDDEDEDEEDKDEDEDGDEDEEDDENEDEDENGDEDEDEDEDGDEEEEENEDEDEDEDEGGGGGGGDCDDDDDERSSWEIKSARAYFIKWKDTEI